MTGAFDRAKAVGITVYGVSSGGPQFGGVRVEAASFDRAVERLESAERLAEAAASLSAETVGTVDGKPVSFRCWACGAEWGSFLEFKNPHHARPDCDWKRLLDALYVYQNSSLAEAP